MYGNFISSFKVFRIFLRYVSIILFFDIFLRLNAQKIENLLKYIDILTILLSILYVFNYGFGISIFAAESYTEEAYYGTLVFRNFNAFPVFLFFVLARLIVTAKKITIFRLLAISILLSSVLLVYTRTYLIISIFIIVAALLLRTFIYKIDFIVVKTIIATLIIVLFSFVITNLLFEKQFEYFSQRLVEVSVAGSIQDVSNLDLRKNIIISRIEKTIEVNPITGLGFIREDVSSKYYYDLFIREKDKPGTILVGDQSWGGFIASIGFAGVAIFFLIILFPFLKLKKIKPHIVSPTFFALGIVLFCELFMNSFIGTVLIDDIFKISFYMALSSYFIKIALDESSGMQINKTFSV